MTTDIDDDYDYDDPDIVNYQDRLAQLREGKGVVRLRFGASAGLVLLRHADVSRAFRDDKVFSKGAVLKPATFPFMGPNLMGWEGQEHSLKRSLVSPKFRRTTIPRYIEPLLRPLAEETVEEIAPLGETDLMATFAKRYPMRIITRLLGIPRDDEDTLATWAKAMLNILHDPDGATRANHEFTEYVTPLIEKRRCQPGDDLISGLVTEEVDRQRLDDEEVFGFLRLLFPAGVDTTWLTLGTLMGLVLQRPDILPRLLDSAEERAWAIEETLRYESTTGTEPRLTLTDVVLSGVEIPAGELLRLAVPVANRDPRLFSDPDHWDLDRRPVDHIAFGVGRHFCLGAFLARAELNIALHTLLRRLPRLRLQEELRVVGVVMRGPTSLHLAWNPV